VTPPGLWLDGSARFGDGALFGPLSFRAEAGGWTVLLGPSGVGKTTILRLFAGLSRAEVSGGYGASDGQPLAGRVALMAQTDLLLPWATALDNICLGARLRGERADPARALRLLAEVGLAGMERRKPGQLSGGQRQRLALARTLMEDRPVVLLDEPFSALDARTRSEMQALAARLLTGRTVLMVSHDAAEAARLGQRILILTRAGLAEAAAPEGPPPRDATAPALLQAQAGLLARLLAA
jgi:putative hydroxymethylpyrimidine transport system ATP-binding protein